MVVTPRLSPRGGQHRCACCASRLAADARVLDASTRLAPTPRYTRGWRDCCRMQAWLTTPFQRNRRNRSCGYAGRGGGLVVEGAKPPRSHRLRGSSLPFTAETLHVGRCRNVSPSGTSPRHQYCSRLRERGRLQSHITLDCTRVVHIPFKRH